MSLRAALFHSGLIALIGLGAGPALAARPELDVSIAARPSLETRAALEASRSAPAFRRLGTVASLDERYDVPSFVWATRSALPAAPPAGASGPAGAESAAREHLARFAPVYRFGAGDAQAATLRSLHDTGRGGIIATFVRSFDGIPVFRDEMKVLMDRERRLVAISGYLPGEAEAGKPASRAFRHSIEDGIGAALDDFAGATFDRAAIGHAGTAAGGYESYPLASRGRPLPAGLSDAQPIRARRVLFHLPDRLEPATYVEVMTESEAVAYVISALDGRLLFRHNQMANDSYTYRAWADNTLHAPFDGPQGNGPTPHPTGNADLYAPPFVPSALTSLQNGPISTNDAWLPPGATVTTGNNVDAYADLSSPDGFSAGDFRANTSSANTFDYTYNVNDYPNANANQRLAAITQLFYDDNFFHDWYYDTGFDEAAGNAQTSNYGRGGIEGDNLHAEAQDYGGTNNANMSTPSDGGHPRMQMYVWNVGGYLVTVNSPASIAGPKRGAGAYFGLSSFNLTANVALVNDGVGTPTDACQALAAGSLNGQIALIDRGSCDFGSKVCNVQAAGAIGAIIVDNVNEEPFQISGTPTCTVTIPILFITLGDGNAIKTALQSGPVNVTMFRGSAMTRDGDLDNQVVAHEWGHYISNRLIGDASGLSNNQGGGMGEGWADFHALLMTVKPEDAAASSNTNWSGVYSMGGYVVSNTIEPTNAYYFGIRRYPYSTDLSKNPLTFRHIQEGVALPAGPPVAFGADGNGNSEVHDTGEVWCNMLWECYASLLRDTGRLTFDQARDRMRGYLVAAYKMTPNAPTILEARDALLSVAYAGDAIDFSEFCAAFARRGAGVGAIGPPRWSNDNVGVTESYVCGGDLQLLSASLDDSVHSCDHDGYLDDGEVGYLTVTLKNSGSTSLSSTTATLSSTNPSVVFQSGTSLAFPPSQPFGTTTARAFIRCSGASGIQSDDFLIQANDPGLAVAGPRNLSFGARANTDEIASQNETVEAKSPPWTASGPVLSSAFEPWSRQEVAPTSHRFWGPDAGGVSDQSIVSPPLQVGTGALSFTFQHAYSFEYSSGTAWDGGVVEVTQNGGASWTDIGAQITPGYTATLSNLSGNPLGGRSAFGGASPGYPTLNPATVSLGTTYANKTIQLRFRVGADQNTGDAGWFVDNLVFSGLTNSPFRDVTADATPCTPVAVLAPPPAELSLAIAGGNPALDRPGFRFALPRAAHVRITVHDVSGRRVATIVDGAFEAGVHVAWWTGGVAGPPPSGVYFARMEADGRSLQQRVVILSR